MLYSFTHMATAGVKGLKAVKNILWVFTSFASQICEILRNFFPEKIEPKWVKTQ